MKHGDWGGRRGRIGVRVQGRRGWSWDGLLGLSAGAGLQAQKAQDEIELLRDHRTPSPITGQRAGFKLEL
jgi:hypothetical protein